MIPTNTDDLGKLFIEAILEITPRIQTEGAQRWKHYEREVGSPSRTRRFRLVWRRSRLFEGGARAGSIFEHIVELVVRTDYAGDHDAMQHLADDDYMQLRDALSSLKATDTGVRIVEPLRSLPATQGATGTDSTDVTMVDHSFEVRYMRTIRP